MRRQGLLALLLGSIVVACCSCESSEMSATNTSDTVYSKYNIHFISEKGKNKASYANWTDWPGHEILPYNSKIQVASLGQIIKLVDVSMGRVIEMEFHSGRMGMSAREYIDLITSPTPVTYEGLSDGDRQGIKAGRAIIGMSKQGVMVALGYPARHQTPSLDENRWIYWKGRFDTYAVEFDNSGKVLSIKK
jgi:hypothetical protein